MTRLLIFIQIICCAPCIAQPIKFFEPFPKADSSQNYNLIGIVGASYLTLTTHTNKQPQLIFTDTLSKKSFTKTLDFISRENTLRFSAIPAKEKLLIIMHSIEGNKAYVNLASVDDRGNLIEPIKNLDSARTDLLGDAAFLNIASTEANQYFLLYRIAAGLKEDNMLVNYLLITPQGDKIATKSFYIPINNNLQQFTGFFIEPDGSVLLGVYDNDNNYRLGSNINIYKTTLVEENPTLTTVYLKEKKPVNLFFARNPNSGRIILTALYRDFYSKNIEGALAVFTNNDNSIDTIVYKKFHPDFKKAITNGLPGMKPQDLLNHMELKQLVIHADHQVSFVADLLAPKKSVPGGRTEKFRYIETERPSQVFNDIRYVAANTNIPKVSTGDKEADRITNQEIEQRNITNAEEMGNMMVSGQMPGRSYEAAAYRPSEKKLNAEAMVYKTIVLNAGQTSSTLTGTITQHLFLPGTPLSVIVPLLSPSKVSLYSYELNKEKKPELTIQSIKFADNKVERSVFPGTQNFVFFQNNAMEVNGKLITLYTNGKGEIGVAEITED